MALGILNVVNIVVVIISAAVTVAMFRWKNDSVSAAWFYAAAAMALIIAFINFTAQPSNYLLQRAVTAMFAGAAVLSIVLWKMNSKQTAKIFCAVSIVLSLCFYLFV
ncbi:hypothetical protein [Bacilliculturomica massiliensis]|uniref:hypothetical protein n=1 Tax=Bacilliculturomica massiliensis TaxID=1917867 RepID=UPI00102F5F86|nr:hypothetical protein [Bacilliculturomica massiliensis]